ncbi:hypothetical protein [Parvularcula marina]|uniref:Uncharacterized protein n=1 Tax=Parvularcula marina TaxID=2292771 RepID=A0A371RG80_9PROT|nr:hypothetical protein [Parvularcula marina]RFB04459.1 hypothetical protein DX908_03655 [Parvularcula marina]
MFSGQESTHFIDDEDGERVYLVARLNAPIQPINLGEQFEDPLEILMKADGLGEFIGGSSLLARDGSIAACDLELEVRQADDATIARVIAALEDIGAPKGSMLIIEGESEAEDRRIPFGTQEGMAIRLCRDELPKGITESDILEEVIAEIGGLLGEAGAYRSYRRLSTDTVLFFYGYSFEAMSARIAGYLARHPLFAHAGIERMAEDTPSA